MVDEIKSIKDNLFKVLMGLSATVRTEDDDDDDGPLGGSNEAGTSPLDASAARALLGALFARAGKSKDEVVQIIAREIGGAVAAMLKEPLSQLAKNQKLQISFEFVPKSDDDDAPAARPARHVAHGLKRTKIKRSSRRRKADKSGR